MCLIPKSLTCINLILLDVSVDMRHLWKLNDGHEACGRVGVCESWTCVCSAAAETVTQAESLQLNSGFCLLVKCCGSQVHSQFNLLLAVITLYCHWIGVARTCFIYSKTVSVRIKTDERRHMFKATWKPDDEHIQITSEFCRFTPSTDNYRGGCDCLRPDAAGENMDASGSARAPPITPNGLGHTGVDAARSQLISNGTSALNIHYFHIILNDCKTNFTVV